MKAYEFIDSQSTPSSYLFQTTLGDWGRFLVYNGKVFPVIPADEYRDIEFEVALWNNISSIYKAPSDREFFNEAYKHLAVKVWSADEDEYTFIGVSNENPALSDKIRASHWAQETIGSNIKYYDCSISAEENYKIIFRASKYIAVPPSEHPYIIGMGLTKQIQNRMHSGKECYIVINEEVKLIKDIYLLQGGDARRYAVVNV